MSKFRTQLVPPGAVHPFVKFLWKELNDQCTSQEEVAARAGWSSSAMRKWRKGERAINLQAIDDVLNVLGYELLIVEKLDDPRRRDVAYKASPKIKQL